jgi:hypothetical protein
MGMSFRQVDIVPHHERSSYAKFILWLTQDRAATKFYLVNKQSNEIAGLPYTCEPVAQNRKSTKSPCSELRLENNTPLFSLSNM